MDRGILIGIAGGSGSGKTLVADTIYTELGSEKVIIIKQDSYYKNLNHLPYEERCKQNFDHPDAFDLPLLKEHLERLLRGEEVEQPLYDFTKHCRRRETKRLGPHLVVVLEGILILEDAGLREMMDIKVFIDTDSDVRLIRRLRRDITERKRSLESVIEQYESSVRPMHLQFVEPSKRYADIIITEGGHNVVAIDLLKTKIRSLL
ncbi:MAG: uridine kinase [Candidatus Eiseniibacteriota bacterium]|nr:MAG: uridine kinase [Candidatus Eisenbacteria bacterium]